MPHSALPRPVLAVTPDAVRHLHGREAVSSLWILFTKCKESLHDGRRLENIAWRLWYRALAQDESDSSSSPEFEEEVDEKSLSFDNDIYSLDVRAEILKVEEEEMVEKRERDRDYGRTGSWQEREKDRLEVNTVARKGGGVMNVTVNAGMGVVVRTPMGTGYRPLTPEGNLNYSHPLRATSVPAPAGPGFAGVPTGREHVHVHAIPLTNGVPVRDSFLSSVVEESEPLCPTGSKVDITQDGDKDKDKERRLSSTSMSTSVKGPISIRRLSSSSACGSVSVGKVICEMLPSSSLGSVVLAPPRPASTSPAPTSKSTSMSMSQAAEPRSAPAAATVTVLDKPTHCDLPITSNQNGNGSGLPTPGTDDGHGNGSFPVPAPAPQRQAEATPATLMRRGDVNGHGSLNAGAGVGIHPVQGGRSSPAKLNGEEECVIENGMGANGVGLAMAPVVPVIANAAANANGGADSVPPNAHLRSPAADNGVDDRAGTGVSSIQDVQVSSPPSAQTHNIPLIYPTPVQVTPTSPSASGPLSPPRLVVVNPTPNPTPHPTPPATPVLLASVNSGHNVALQLKAFKSAQVQYLGLPSLSGVVNGGADNESLLPSPLLRVPGPEGRRVVAMMIEPVLDQIPEVKEEQQVHQQETLQHPNEQQKSTSLSSASSGCSELSATTNATSMIEEAERDKKKPEQMVPSSSVLVVDGRTPVPVLPSATLLTPAPTLVPQFQAQLAESPVSQASMSPTKNGTSPRGSSPASGSGGSPSQSGKVVARAGVIRRASSGGASTSSRSGSTGTGSTSRALSRSRSREGTGNGLTMTTTRPAATKAAVSRPSRGRVMMTKASGAIRRGGSVQAIRRSTSEAGDEEKALERRQSLAEEEKVRERDREREKQARDVKRLAKFNIGSNSDDGSGMGSKSAGSGSDASGVGRGLSPRSGGLDAMAKGKGKLEGQGLLQQERERKIQMMVQQEYEMLQQERMREQQRVQQVQQAQQRQQQVDLQRQQKELQQQAKLREKAVQDKDLQRQLDALVAAAAAGQFGIGKPGGTKDAGASNVLNAAIKDLAQPLLPQNKKKIVIATSESECSEDEEEEEWISSSEEEIEVKRGHTATRQPPQPAVGQQQQQYPQRPLGPQRTQSSSGYNAYNNRRPLTKQQRLAQANTQLMIEEAQARLNREQEMFAKRPTASFANLQTAQRTRSVGLLSQLMNPDPQIFPPEHPYRRGYSSGEIAGGGYQRQEADYRRQQQQLEQRRHQQFDQLSHQQQLEQCLRQQQLEQERKQQLQEEHRKQQQQQARAVPLPPSMAPKLGKSKSAAALPVMSGVQVGSVAASRPVSPRMNGVIASGVLNGASSGNSGYRLGPRPQGVELEDDSGSEDESGMGIPKSAAEQKLKALAERGVKRSSVTSPIKSARRESREVDENEVPTWAQEERPPAQRRATHDRRTSTDFFEPHQLSSQPQQSLQTPSPIPLGHPYNLPAPAAPMTPRTTRRNMLQTELSESLRRQLLWERQVSRAPRLRRTASGGGPRGNLLNGLRPLTTTPSMVQLTARGSGTQNSDRERRRSTGLDQHEEEERDQARMAAITRNRSWAAADDFHLTGW